MNYQKNSMSYIFPISYFVFLKTFRQWHRFLQTSEQWNKKQIEKYQLQKLRKIVKEAYHFVPFYTKQFDDYNIHPEDIKTLSDLKQIPFLIKDDIRSHLNELKATHYPLKAFEKTKTGGTTGNPLIFYVERARWLGKHFAFNRNYMEHAEYRPSNKVISITGNKEKMKHHPFLRTLEFSNLHMKDNDLNTYAKKIESYQPKFITSYPSALMILTKFLSRNNKTYPQLKAIFCHGETLFDWQRRFFEETYHCRVYDQYGHREQCVFATTCTKSNLYHVFPQYGIVEILDEKEKIITTEGGIGEIVATSLHKNLFPFIRYKTGDLAQVTKKTCGCGRNYPLIKKIIGRKQDFLFTTNNDMIPLTGLYHLIVESTEHVKECQLYQDTEGELIITVVKKKDFSKNDLDRLKGNINKKIGDLFNITVIIVDEIPRTTHGKYRYLIQKIPVDKQK